MRNIAHYGFGIMAGVTASFVLLLLEHPALALYVLLLFPLTSTLPDQDKRFPFIRHKGPTHSILMLPVLSITGAIIGAITYYMTHAIYNTLIWDIITYLTTLDIIFTELQGYSIFVIIGISYIVTFISSLIHIFTDALNPWGVKPFSPIDETEYTFELIEEGSKIEMVIFASSFVFLLLYLFI